jgi:hypothetical protein
MSIRKQQLIPQPSRARFLAMAIVSCPECGKKLKIADTSVGKKVKGPCGHVFVAQAEAQAAPKPAAAPVAPEKVYVACTECGSKLKVATTSLGKKMKCPKCLAVFVANPPEEEPAPKAKAKPAVSDDDMDDLLSFAQADAKNGKSEAAEDEDLFKDEPIKSRAQRKMDEEEEAADEPKPKGKAKPKPADDDDDEPKGKKPGTPPRFGKDEESAKPVYPSRLIPNILVSLMVLAFGGLVGAIFFDVNIAKELGLPEAQGVPQKKPKTPDNAAADKEAEKKAKEAEAKNKEEMKGLEGTWIVESPDELKGKKFEFADGKVTTPDGEGPFSVDASHDPKWINLPKGGKTILHGIYHRDGDSLKWRVAEPKMVKMGKDVEVPGARPTKFDAADGMLVVLNREKKSDTDPPEPKNGSVKLDGIWIAESAVVNGKSDDRMKGEPLVFADGKVTGVGPVPFPYSVKVAENPPHAINFMVAPKVSAPGIFKIDGDRLHLSFPGKTMQRPTDFEGKDGMAAVFRRATKGDPLYFRNQSATNLKIIGLAVHGYHDFKKRLPSAVTDATGKPLLSWRVAILPYMDGEDLYKEFDLEQPWDHPTNKKLIAKMPKYFAVPNIAAPEGMTHYRAFTGPDMPFEPGRRLTMVGISDGTSNVIGAFEAKEPTIWTKPDDLEYNAKGPLPKFGVSPLGFNAMFLDATVRFLPLPMPDDLIRPFFATTSGKTREWRIDDPDFVKNWKPGLKEKDKDKDFKDKDFKDKDFKDKDFKDKDFKDKDLKDKIPDVKGDKSGKFLERQKEEKALLAAFRESPPKDLPGVVALLPHEPRVVAVAFSPAAPVLASVVQGNKDEAIKLWDMKTLKLIKAIPGEIKTNEPVLTFSPAGDLLAVISNSEKFLKVFSVPGGEEVKSFTFPTRPTAVAFSSDGKRLTLILHEPTQKPEVKIWELPDWKERPLDAKFDQFGICTLAPSGDELYQSVLSGDITVHDLAARKTRGIKNTNGIGSKAVISPNGKYIASAGFVPGGIENVQLLDLQTLKTQKLAEDRGEIRFIQFSPDSNHLVFLRDEHRLVDIAAKKEIAKIAGLVDAVAFSPGGVLLAYGEQGQVRVIAVEDLAAGKIAPAEKK